MWNKFYSNLKTQPFLKKTWKDFFKKPGREEKMFLQPPKTI